MDRINIEWRKGSEGGRGRGRGKQRGKDEKKDSHQIDGIFYLFQIISLT